MRRLSKETRAGILITVSIHLAVIIVLLETIVTPGLRREMSIEFDFSQIEELERLQKELEFKKDVNKRLNDLLAQHGLDPIEETPELKNVAVNRHTNDLLQENARVQQEIKESLERTHEENIVYEEYTPQKEEEQAVEYNGPSIVSYDLGGRKASRLPIPAYRCLGGGEVTVLIEVDPQGNVINAKVKSDVSTNDSCLRDYAVKAAYRAKFSKSATAPAKQRGDIVYSFIAQ